MIKNKIQEINPELIKQLDLNAKKTGNRKRVKQLLSKKKLMKIDHKGQLVSLNDYYLKKSNN